MLYGGVNYRLKANPDNDVYVPWAGRVVFAPHKEGEDIKMQFYQVYLVSYESSIVLDCSTHPASRTLRLSRERNKVQIGVFQGWDVFGDVYREHT